MRRSQSVVTTFTGTESECEWVAVAV